ncbi:LXG domain-containing protein [Bacillus wiedmannii]|uniref:T7SS effector LXG polymorphic toxin n=2 Tax=Bacillus wiedmannii TaxID=1890302 RepID=UPI001CBD4174|nr:T7SS effector LXG polymorphic toxin [Bacillus wiedmannii]MBZ4223511.1 LXG domain-containing protein [Bacillus wiedmannii]
MSLNMYLGEVQNQTQSMNAVCTATIQGMEQAIQSIDAFAVDTVLQGQTYSSAKAFFVQTFRPLAQGIIYLCEELIRQNDAFPSQFQSQVASTDVIEHEILEQIREIDRMKTSMEAVNQAMPMPGMDAMVNLFIVMRQKLQEKLDHLYQFNQNSSNNYSTALQLATSIAAGLAEVQSGKGFNALTGIFSVKELNMEWTVAIQKKSEDKVHAVQIEKEAVKNDWFLMDSKVVMETANGVATATGLGATGLGATGLGATGLGATGLGATGLGATGLGATGLGATGLGAVGLGAVGLGATGLGAAGLGAAGLGATGLGAAGLGAAGWIINKVNLQSITDVLSTKSNEQYLYNHESGPLYAKAIGGELKAGAIAGGSASYNTVKVGIEGGVDVNGRKLKGEASLSMANAEVSAKIDKNGFELGAEASLAKYEAGIDIPIPFTDHDLHIGGSASLGQAGGTVKVSSSGFKVNLPWGPGASPVGTGVEIEIK